jgi:ABC-2 type transport system ATP-binding protein
MIRVSHLTKKFPGRVAVNDVSFEVSRGEIVGFLGPNGAGKTTTMRILTGYLPATGGEVSVAGRDVFTESRDVRSRVGYLPESCPLYPEMRVDEYLRFRGRLKGVPRGRLKERLRQVKELCGLPDVGRRIVGQLSKGYRQRVGLAEALVHEPELLILDEPTIGLDPNQIRQVRELIGHLAERHTILLSTHILPEVEMTCRRVLIINEGRIVASDSPRRLRERMRGGAQVLAEVRGPRDQVQQRLADLPQAQSVTVTEAEPDWLACRVVCEGNSDLRQAVFRVVADNGWLLRELKLERQSLEDVFLALTRGGDIEEAGE